MSLNYADVKKIAHLARLNIAEQDGERYAQELSSILNLAEQLLTVNTANVTPLAHPLSLMQRLREDVVTEQDLRAKYQAIAPLIEDGLYLVPKVID